MKTIILTAAILLGAIFCINKSAYAAPASDEKVSTILTDINKINKIEVYGNVQVYVSDGTTDQVKVYNRYYNESALVQDQNGTLRIASYKNEKLVVWVTVSDLRSLSAYDNSEVKSFGKLSAIDLDVKLYNNASANLELDAFQANIDLKGYAKAKLTGNVSRGELKYEKTAFLNAENLVSANLTKIAESENDKDETIGFVSF